MLAVRAELFDRPIGRAHFSNTTSTSHTVSNTYNIFTQAMTGDAENYGFGVGTNEGFEFIYENYLSEGYERIRDYKPELDYSNFTKTDSNYLTFVAKTILRDFDGNINTKLQKLLDNIFYKPTISEKKADDKLFALIEPNYEAWLKRPKDSDVSIDDLDLVEELKEYRKKIWYESRKRVKPYEVFTNKQMKDIIDTKPTSIDELSEINKISQEQLDKYGEDIIAIVSKFK
jgi:superfamily II DNA helicase RecQ